MIDKPFGFFQGIEMPNAGWWEALWPDPAGVLAMVGIKSGMDVIDLCSGDGWFTLQIAKLARRVVAIDINRALLEVARHRLRESNLSNCHFVAGDAYNITRLWTLPVDFVFLANAFHGVPDQLRLASSVRDALKSLGRFAIVNWQRERVRKQPCWASRADRERNCECHQNRQSKSLRLTASNSAS
jgi:ubiquinone/menaquinone biosynthesis C-methylase UbiE